jgi:hypothetical protein
MGREDHRLMLEILAGISDSERADYSERGSLRAATFLTANQTFLKILAETLEEVGNLDGAVFLKIADKYGDRIFAPL